MMRTALFRRYENGNRTNVSNDAEQTVYRIGKLFVWSGPSTFCQCAICECVCAPIRRKPVCQPLYQCYSCCFECMHMDGVPVFLPGTNLKTFDILITRMTCTSPPPVSAHITIPAKQYRCCNAQLGITSSWNTETVIAYLPSNTVLLLTEFTMCVALARDNKMYKKFTHILYIFIRMLVLLSVFPYPSRYTPIQTRRFSSNGYLFNVIPIIFLCFLCWYDVVSVCVGALKTFDLKSIFARCSHI